MATQHVRSLAVVSATFLTIICALSQIAMAADGPNRITSSDVSAGRFVDSLLGPDAPQAQGRRTAPPRPQRRAAQSRSAQSRSAQSRSTLRGKLVKNSKVKDGFPPYALVDRYGGVLRYIEPVESVDLQAYLGKTVGVRRDTGDVLLASQLALPRRARSRTGVQLAQHEEPIPVGEPTPADESLPAGETAGQESIVTEDFDNGPIYMDEGSYDDSMNFGGCATCGSGVCRGGGCGYGARGVIYAHAEYLLWTLEGMNTPALVLQFDGFDAPLGAPIRNAVNPRVIFGGNRVLEDDRDGGRITLGVWLDDWGQWAIEADYLGLGDLEESFSAGTMDGLAANPGFFIGRPFFNTADTGTAARGPAQEDVDTDRLDGNVRVDIRSEFQAAGIRLRHNLCCREGCTPCCGDTVSCGSGVGCGAGFISPNGPLGRLCNLLRNGTRHHDVLYGFRWVNLDESLRVTEDLQDLTQPVSQIDVFDDFSTQNNFFGGELGYETNWQHGRWSLNLLSKIAIGSTNQQVSIRGDTVITPAPAIASPVTGGLLAQNIVLADGTVVGNIGDFERDEFSVIPELGLTLGYNVTRRLKLTAGYTLLYWSNVVRPGDQIDIDVNGNLLARNGPPAVGAVVAGDHPRFTFVQTDLWAQGLNLGAEYTW